MKKSEIIDRYGIDKWNEYKRRSRESTRRKRMGLERAEKLVNDASYKIKGVPSYAEDDLERADEMSRIERKVQKELSSRWYKVSDRDFILIATAGNISAHTKTFDIKVELTQLDMTPSKVEEFRQFCAEYEKNLQK